MTLNQVKRLAEEKKIEFFLCSFVEMSGLPKAKVVPTTHLEDMAEEGAGFAGFATGHMGQGPHDPDIMSIPDFNSLAVLPWRPNVAWVAGNAHVEGKPWAYCPRTILQRQLAKARRKGYTFNVGVEPEFMLLKRNEQGSYVPADSLDILPKPCYDLVTLHRSLDLMTTLIKYMQELGWGPYANDHEDANCQFEINWSYADALTTADRHTFFRWMVKSAAEQRGLMATFMPKPFSHLTGSGAHFHLSLWDKDNEKNLFLDKRDRNGLSQQAYWFMGGLLRHARALAAVTSPLVNSYKRLIRGAPRSGATWAPVYTTYGGSNRTQMIRIPGPGRIENRTVDGAANPYLACAAMLAAGLDGIEKRMDPGKRNDDNLYEIPEAELQRRGIGFLPTTLREALECLEGDKVVKEALGAEYADYYIEVKREEWRQYHQHVSQWELDKYLPIY
ncbi:MAG: type III glutamate--ammonia ligase [Candidatus Handelsmanbacteria bacterium]|nr:type III glutamate--ammonia ligase [Candidatus Handelsmanbacteria bacterium]